MQAVPHHLVMGPSNHAWLPTQPFDHPIQGMMVDGVAGWPLDAAVQGRSNDGCVNYMHCEAGGGRVEQRAGHVAHCLS